MTYFKHLNRYILTKEVAVHVLCWSVFIFYELYIFYFMGQKFEPGLHYICYYSLNIIYFYTLAHLLSLIFSRAALSLFQGFLLFIALLCICVLIKFFLAYFFQAGALSLPAYYAAFVKYLFSTLYRIGYFTILATFYWAAGHISHFRKQTQAAELQRVLANQNRALAETRLANAQNAYLRQQLNPHLLFNALNFIYSSVYPHSAEASHSVLLLSDILRFSLEDSGPDGKVPLSAEVEQVKRIIALNRYRFDREPALEFSIQGNPEPFRIIPLLLFTLTENVFKHGNLLDNARPAVIRLTIDPSGQLAFSTHNLKKAKSGYPQRQSLGLQNSRIRLDYSYAGKNSLRHTETKEFYDLHLSIQL